MIQLCIYCERFADFTVIITVFYFVFINGIYFIYDISIFYHSAYSYMYGICIYNLHFLPYCSVE